MLDRSEEPTRDEYEVFGAGKQSWKLCLGDEVARRSPERDAKASAWPIPTARTIKADSPIDRSELRVVKIFDNLENI